MKNLLNTLFVCVLLTGCQSDTLNENNETADSNNSLTAKAANENNKPDIHTQIVLGNKLVNPYSVGNMQAAFKYYSDNIDSSKFPEKDVKASHYYIKITPQSEADLETLDKLDDETNEDTPVLQDHPVDYEVITEGDFYIKPNDENDLYHPVYTTIPVGYTLPGDLKYEVLDKLYEPADNEFDVETVSLYFAGWKDDLEADGINLTDQNSLNLYLKNQMSGKSSNKFYPTGRVTIENTGTNTTEGLMQAEISYGRVFWWHYTYTDNNGNFVGNAKKYRGSVSIRAKWRGNTATIRKTWNEVLGMFVSDYLMSVNKNSNGATKYINYTSFSGQGNHLWAKGTVNNGLRKYVDYCNSKGITNTISHANVWAWEGSNQYGATPMLHKYPQLPIMSTLANVGQAGFWQVMINTLAGSAINLVPAHLRPDQIFSGLDPKGTETRSDSRRIHQLVFHESGHYSHASKAGAPFWAQLFASEISNSLSGGSDPYKDGTKPSLQAGARIGLCEGWATITEFYISNFYYSGSRIKTNSGSGWMHMSYVNGYLEDFSICDRPMSIQRTDEWSWFSHGLIVDVLDNSGRGTGADSSTRRSGSGVLVNNITDDVNLGASLYDLGPVFSRLTSSVNNPTDLKNSLISANPAQSTKITTLFQGYGY
jgi:hypothetical protein